MIKFVALSFVLATSLSSHASEQSNYYRMYTGKIGTAQEQKTIDLKINDEVQEHRFENAGSRKYLEVTIYEQGMKSCSEALYLDDGILRLCSGSHLKFSLATSVLKDKAIKADLFMNGFAKPVGVAEMILEAIQHGNHDGGIDE